LSSVLIREEFVINELGDISFNLLGVLGTFLAFEGFLIALLYSGTNWSPTGKKLYKLFIAAMVISIVAVGLLCIDTAIDSQFWEKLGSFGSFTMYLFFIPVVLILLTAVIVGVYVVKMA